MTPNVDGVFNPVPGPANCTVFVALKASALNCTVNLSIGLKFLNMERSRFRIPGARTSGRVRDVLPNVKASGCEKTLVLKY